MFHQLDERPSAPITPPSEELRHDGEIITHQNHPLSSFHSQSFSSFNPSFVGKTWGEMKQRESNRSTNFFVSDNLSENLKTLYASLNKPIGLGSRYYEACVANWRMTPSTTLNLSAVNFFSDSISLPSSVPSVIINKSVIPPSFAESKTLVTMKVQSKSLPVMPHIQILEWTPEDNCICDFSGWTSLRILTICLFYCKGCTRIKLPTGLISFSFISYRNFIDYENENETFEDVFKDTDHNTTAFQSLKHLYIKGVQWSALPMLSNCISLDITHCNKLKTVEAPKCQVLSVDSCPQFLGFGPTTMASNYHLDKVVLFNNYNNHFQTKIPFHFPPGSPSGYKLVDLFRYPVSSLPCRFDPFAYISIFNSGSYLYIKNAQARENLAFYFNRVRISHDAQEDYNDIIKNHFPKNGESLMSMADRVYGFNWPKFITKIQRQHRFNKFIKQEQKELVAFLPEVICKYNISKLLGATQTFKPFNKPKEEQKQVTYLVSYISSTKSKRKRIR